MVATEKNVCFRRGSRRFSQGTDVRFFRLGGTDVLGLFCHVIEYFFAQGVLEKFDSGINAFAFPCSHWVIFFVCEIFALCVQFADLTIVFAVIQIQ